MNINTPEIMTMLILLVVIMIPVILIRMSNQKKQKRKLNYFTNACHQQGLNIEFLMQRKNRFAAFDNTKNQIALIDFSQSEQPDIAIHSFKETEKQVKTDGNEYLTRKITLIVSEQKEAGKNLEIVFYDADQDSHSKADSYLKEAEKWEQVIK